MILAPLARQVRVHRGRRRQPRFGVWRGSAAVVDLLISYRADANERDRDGDTPVFCCRLTKVQSLIFLDGFASAFSQIFFLKTSIQVLFSFSAKQSRPFRSIFSDEKTSFTIFYHFVLFFSRASDERSYQKTRKGQAV